jgi:predicted N-acetyltransferase YhbS
LPEIAESRDFSGTMMHGFPVPLTNGCTGQDMKFKFLDKRDKEEVAGLFRTAFTSSEGEREGQLVGNLASELCAIIDNREVICLGAYENTILSGSIFFTRLRFHQPVLVYMLAPVAVSPEQQGKGIGQALISYGLSELAKRAVNVVITYGDPSFYSRVGFEPLSENVIRAPLELSMPIGWLGQSLTADPIPTIDERPTCVAAFHDPAYW